MNFFVGTSGYSIPEWKGSFYPKKIPQGEMLNFYAQHFSTVEINNTFYKMPNEENLVAWTTQVPANFRFSIKSPQAITHRRRLKNAEDDTKFFVDTTAVLKKHRGPLLFGLPPNFKKDVPRLDEFLKTVGKKVPICFEFRNEAWFDQEVYDCLAAHSCALCVADAEDLPASPLMSSAPFGYIRLRRESYTDKQLADWVKKIRDQDWEDVYVYFRHEDTGTGPVFANKFLELIAK